MPVIADVIVEHPDLVLTPTIREGTDLQVEVVSHSTTDPETRQFSFLVRTDDFESFERSLDADGTVGDWSCHADFGDEGRIYQIAYGDDIELVSPKASKVGGLILETTSTDRGWKVRFQFPDRESLADLYRYCERQGMQVEVVEVYTEREVNLGGPVGVTEPQYEALITAFEEGYFRQPREITLDELADVLGISSTAAGGRLRRGMENLIEATLADS